MRPITWSGNLQAERRCPQDDGGWLIIRQQGNKVGVTVQHRVIIASEMNLEPQGRSELRLGKSVSERNASWSAANKKN